MKITVYNSDREFVFSILGRKVSDKQVKAFINKFFFE